MKISLIIPAHNEEKYIKDCLESVEKYGKDFFEVIVVNNASTDTTAQIARSFSFVRVVDQPQKGLLWARQKGLEESRGDFLAYIDSDCRIYPTWFEKISKEFNNNPNLVALSGPYKYYDLPFVQNILANLTWWFSGPLIYWLVGYMIIGGNFVAKKETLLEIGGFNTDISFYGEDTNIARRLSKKGKVKLKIDFFIYTSGRRIIKEGLLKAYWVYGLNYLWEVLFKKPLTKKYKDIR